VPSYQRTRRMSRVRATNIPRGRPKKQQNVPRGTLTDIYHASRRNEVAAAIRYGSAHFHGVRSLLAG